MGGTFETVMPGTFHSAMGGTFETVLGGTIKPLQSKFGRIIEELVVIIQIYVYLCASIAQFP